MELVFIGYLAGLLTTVALIPQVVKSFRTKRTVDISLGMTLILAAGLSSWLAYGIVTGDPALIIANSFQVPLAYCLVVMKLRYG